MTDTQILTLVIGITFPVLGIIGAITAVLYNNKRMDDLRIDLKATIQDFQKHVDEKIDNGFEHMGLLLRLHEAEHHKK